MSHDDDRVEPHIVDPTFVEHEALHIRFAQLQSERASGDPGASSLAADCQPPGQPAGGPTLRIPERAEDPTRTSLADWMFRSRKTGRITLAQFPNWPLAAWFVASAVMWLGHPEGWMRASLVVLSSAALGVWAGDEVLRGVNPFRRFVGLATLGWLAFSLVRLG